MKCTTMIIVVFNQIKRVDRPICGS